MRPVSSALDNGFVRTMGQRLQTHSSNSRYADEAGIVYGYEDFEENFEEDESEDAPVEEADYGMGDFDEEDDK